MSFLLDTNVVSESRKGRRADAGVRRWLSSVASEDMHISVIVLGEVRQGIELLRRRDMPQAEALDAWLSRMRRDFAGRILPVTEDIAEEWGRMNVPNPISSRDALMAATAKVHNMAFVTRNTADVERSGARLLNPFEG